MPGATCRKSPHAASDASAVRFGTRAVSSSDFPVSGLGNPPSPSNDINTIFVVFGIASDRISSSMRPVYRSPDFVRTFGDMPLPMPPSFKP